MPASWVNTSVYEGDDVDADGHLWGLGDTYGLNDAEDVQIAKVSSFISRFPKPTAGRGVRADAMLAALRELLPLARKVANLTDGAKKRGLFSRVFGPGGQGTLTGDTVTVADKVTANRIIYEVEKRLPTMGAAAIDAGLYAQLKEAAHQLLKIGHDIGDNVSAVIDNFSRAIDAYGDALVALPQTVVAAGEALVDLTQRAGQAAGDVVCASPAGAFMWHCWPTWKKAVVVTAGVAVGSALLYGVYRILQAAAPVATAYAKQRVGLHGVRRVPRSHRLKGRRRSR